MKTKRGLSEIVGYVILIVIAMTLSVAVYAWLKVIVPKNQLECPDDISISIENYNCYNEESSVFYGPKIINLTIRNRGLSEIDGINMKIANRTGGKAVYPFAGIGPDSNPISLNGTIYFVSPIRLSYEKNMKLNYTKFDKINEIQIIPVKHMREPDGHELKYVLCSKSIIQQEITGCN